MTHAAEQASFFSPLLPRVSVTGMVGNTLFGEADVMFPIAGNANELFYTDIQGKLGQGKNQNDTAWMSSMGTGYRRIINNYNLLGAYLFVEGDQTQQHNRFLLLNPGIEKLGVNWDFRVNGYFPIGTKKKFTYSAFGDQIGISNAVQFQGHQQFGRIFNFYEEIGSGGDAEFGHHFANLHQLALYGGGYSFNMQDHSNIHGIEGRIEYPLNPYLTILVSDTYDNEAHNTIAAGLRLSMGGVRSCPANIYSKILDPIQRNLGALSQGNGIPSVQVRRKGPITLERDNIWFFTQNKGAIFDLTQGTSGCGTFENPCLGDQFTQNTIDTIDGIAKNANFYFNGGNYPLLTSKNSGDSGQVALNAGQNIFGRTADYTLPAQGNARSSFIGRFNLKGNNHIDSIQLFNNDGAQTTGINATNTNTIILNNITIGAQDSQSGYVNAIAVDNVHDMTITNSMINAYANEKNTDSTAIGINANQSNITLNHSQINAIAMGSSKDIEADGISGVDNTLKLSQSSIDTTATSDIGVASSFGITDSGTASVTLDQSSIESRSASNKEFAVSRGINLDMGTADVERSQINVNAKSNSFLATDADINVNNGIINVSQSKMQADCSSVSGQATAINLATNFGSINIDRSFLQGTASSNSAIATTIGVDAFSGEIDIRHSTLRENATTQSGKRAVSIGVHGVLNNDIFITESNVQANSIANTTLAQVMGVSTEGGNTRVTINQCKIGAQAVSNSGNSSAFGINTAIPPHANDDRTIIKISKSILNVAATSSTSGNASAYGIFGVNSDIDAQFNLFQISALAPQNTATTWGIFNGGDSSIQQSNNLFKRSTIGKVTAGGDVSKQLLMIFSKPYFNQHL